MDEINPKPLLALFGINPTDLGRFAGKSTANTRIGLLTNGKPTIEAARKMVREIAATDKGKKMLEDFDKARGGL